MNTYRGIPRRVHGTLDWKLAEQSATNLIVGGILVGGHFVCIGAADKADKT